MKTSVDKRFSRPLLSIALASIAILLSGCASLEPVVPTKPLPRQTLSTPVPDGQTRVIFFNDSNFLMYGLDGTGTINFFLDEEPVATVPIGGWVQVFAEPREYSLKLQHHDMGLIEDTFDLSIVGEETYVRLYCGITSTKFELLESLPENFNDKFDPMVIRP